ncbi:MULTISPECIES: hypothetical protein [Persicobacter]|uniref:Uncharacterized protein n=1 Tax=Persicobacter diffluens TaxID=981 RepID=A0AAN4VVJ5_9BACT|nr:hypothetical protein [Persicobacter sp. CCB-QB2]GJM60741.1 hypothetical protein PEDI_12930 [Persicobacter diffluens]
MASHKFEKGQRVTIKKGVKNPLDRDLDLSGQVVTVLKISNPNSDDPILLVEFGKDALDQWPQGILEDMICQHPKWDQTKIKASQIEM